MIQGSTKVCGYYGYAIYKQENKFILFENNKVLSTSINLDDLIKLINNIRSKIVKEMLMEQIKTYNEKTGAKK